jgi:hypothetical protein
MIASRVVENRETPRVFERNEVGLSREEVNEESFGIWHWS